MKLANLKTKIIFKTLDVFGETTQTRVDGRVGKSAVKRSALEGLASVGLDRIRA